MTNEEYVRSKWEKVKDRETFVAGHGHVVTLPVIWKDSMSAGYFRSKEIAWAAAAEFTREREEQIRHVEEEIALLEGWKHLVEVKNPAALRILGREQAALAELKRGMKQQ